MTWIAPFALAADLAAVAITRRVLARRWPDVGFIALRWRQWSAGEWVAAALGLATATAVAGGSIAAALGAHADPPSGAVGAGIVLSGAAIALQVWSQRTMGRSWRVGVDRASTADLVTAGPFRWVRNPIYAGMVLLAAATALLSGSAWVIGGAVLTLVFVEWQVRAVEEPFLMTRHDRAFREWGRGSGRFVPGVGRL